MSGFYHVKLAASFELVDDSLMSLRMFASSQSGVNKEGVKTL